MGFHMKKSKETLSCTYKRSGTGDEMRKGDTVELKIDKVAFGGQGIARVDGYVIFVAGTAPGDLVKARLYKKKKAFGEARLVEVLEPSPERVKAPCPYSGHCGGCQWQHLRYESQLHYKRGHVAECLEHIGGIKDVLVREVRASEKAFGYRNKMEFSFSDRPWLLPEELGVETAEGFALGLHVPGTYSKVIDIEGCLLQQERGNEILRSARRLVKESGVPVYGLKSHEGFWRFLTLRYSNTFDQWMVNLVTSEESIDLIRPVARKLALEFPIKTIVNNINGRKASIAAGDREFVLLGEGRITDTIGPFRFQISANSFFQTNTPAAGLLYEQVVDFAELTGKENVLDLYSGTGTIPIFLSPKAGSVTGIEIVPSAVKDAQSNCRENKIDNCRFLCKDVSAALSEIAKRPDVLVIDPPRAGMHPGVLAQVLAMLPEKVVYISCNPSSLARDLSRMVPFYEIVEVSPFDLFPQTFHVEAVVSMRLRRGSSLL
jgi:23S rRNA (uracil1939-C5)-methyltransferase